MHMLSWFTRDFISFVELGTRQGQTTPRFSTLQDMPALCAAQYVVLGTRQGQTTPRFSTLQDMPALYVQHNMGY
jgi:hypothetical protein